MFGISSGEILILLVLALIIIKPEDLPMFVHKLGQMVGTLRGYYRSLQMKGQTLKRELENMATPAVTSETTTEPTAGMVLPGLPGTASEPEPDVIVVPVIRETETAPSLPQTDSTK